MNYLKAFTAQSKEVWALTQNENVLEDILKTFAMASAAAVIDLPKHCGILSCQVQPSGSFTLYIAITFGHSGQAFFKFDYNSVDNTWDHNVKATEAVSTRNSVVLQLSHSFLNSLVLNVSDELAAIFSALANVLTTRPYKQA